MGMSTPGDLSDAGPLSQRTVVGPASEILKKGGRRPPAAQWTYAAG
jgi:hypothetical protein